MASNKINFYETSDIPSEFLNQFKVEKLQKGPSETKKLAQAICTAVNDHKAETLKEIAIAVYRLEKLTPSEKRLQMMVSVLRAYGFIPSAKHLR